MILVRTSGRLRILGAAWLLSGAALLPGCGGLELDDSEDGDLLRGASRAVYALDVSVYTRMISWSEYDCLWDQGVRHVVVGTQDLAVA